MEEVTYNSWDLLTRGFNDTNEEYFQGLSPLILLQVNTKIQINPKLLTAAPLLYTVYLASIE